MKCFQMVFPLPQGMGRLWINSSSQAELFEGLHWPVGLVPKSLYHYHGCPEQPEFDFLSSYTVSNVSKLYSLPRSFTISLVHSWQNTM